MRGDAEVDGLFELPPEEFVEARNDLAKRLTEQGEKDLARDVKSLRRPSVAAWAVNQLVRRRPKDLERLLEAGASLRDAHARAISGKKVDLREPAERRRSAVAALMDAADELLASTGRDSSSTREAIETTFEAAALDEDAAERVREGRLTKELPAPSGFGGAALLEVVPSGDDADERRARELEEAARRATDAAERAERRAAEARERAERLRREAEEAEERADAAERRASELEDEARSLRERADEVAAEAAG